MPPARRKRGRPARARGRRTRRGSTRLQRFLQSRFGFWLRRIATGLFGLMIGFSVVYVLLLDRQVRHEFAGARWNLPARVYASPLKLFPGELLSRQELINELTALGYRRQKRPDGPGSFSASASRVDLVTRAFDFPDGSEPSRGLQVSFSGNRIARIVSAPGGRTLREARLEPRVLGGMHSRDGEDRILVRKQDFPPSLLPTLLAVEDRHFYHHSGINPIAIGRALFANVRAGRAVQGGSTLTQQLVKNYFLNRDRTFTRKAKEAVLSFILEWRYDKDTILEAYVNEIFLGQDGARAIHGFGLAAEFYFGRPLAELKLPQVALLVGLARGASYYNPRRHPKRALERRNSVLEQLADAEDVPAKHIAAARNTPLGVTKTPGHGSSGHPAFVELVRRQLRREYREEDLETGGLRVFTTLNPQVQKRAEDALRLRLSKIEKERRLPANSLQGAVVVSGREAGDLQAIVGGRQTSFDGFNRALDAVRPVGSLAKPAVYLAALSQPRRWALNTRIDDAPLTIKDKSGKPWSPKNYDRKSHGMVPLRQSLAKSYNVSTVRLAMRVGMRKIVNTLNSLGIKEKLSAYPSLALGATSQTPLTMNQVYQTLANGGYYTPLRAIRAVTTRDGRTLQRFPRERKKVADPRAVFLLNDALKAVVDEGTGRGIKRMLPAGLEAAGKTGTTNGLRDSWFAGFTHQRVAVVWVGRDDNKPMKLTGAQGAGRVWGQLMAGEHPERLGLNVPVGISEQRVAGYTGTCSDALELPFYSKYPPAATLRCNAGSVSVATTRRKPKATSSRTSKPKADAFPLDWLYEDL